MPPANMEANPLFGLLTDALRAGPGSPQWRDAIAALREQGVEGADEYNLLLEVRENLESGKDYREVRAGTGFTRKLLSEIEKEQPAGKRSGLPTATWSAILCGFLIAVGVGFLIHGLMSNTQTLSGSIDGLQDKSNRFVDTLASAAFDKSIPSDWHEIGSLPLQADRGLRPALSDAVTTRNSALLGGGMVWNQLVPAEQAFAVDVAIHAARPTAAVLLEAFVSTDPNFSASKGTASRDLVWQLDGREQHILLSGSGQALKSPPAFSQGETIRLIVNRDVAIIELVKSDNKTQRLWAGPHALGAGPRIVGVRFLQTGAPGKEDLSVTSITITK